MVSIISQFELAKYILRLDKNNTHKEIINIFFSNMPINLKRKFLEDIKQWIITAEKEDSYWDKYVNPLSDWFDEKLEQIFKYSKKNKSKSHDIVYNQNIIIDGMHINEILQGISDMHEINNSYSNSEIVDDLLYEYNINHVGVVEINVYNDNHEIFNINFAGNCIILHNMGFLETNHVFSFNYEFDKSLFDKNADGIVKGNSEYYLSNRGFLYTIDLEEKRNGKYKRKILKWITEKQFEDDIERKGPNAKYLSKK